MADVLFLGLMVGFFALAVALVRACDRILGADDDVVVGTLETADDAEAAAA